MEDLVEWLRLQLDEDERVAKAATEGPWRVTARSNHPYAEEGEIHTDRTPKPYRVVTHGDFHEAVGRLDAEHIALHDPARVLREVEAKRRIVDLHSCNHECSTFEDNCAWINDEPCSTLLLLALPYSDRPRYREEWKP